MDVINLAHITECIRFDELSFRKKKSKTDLPFDWILLIMGLLLMSVKN